MSFTNQTQHYGLPQWVGEDKPTFLVDMNNAYAKIDEELYNASAESASALQLASSANNKGDTVLQNLSETNEEVSRVNSEIVMLKGSCTTVENRVTQLEGGSGSVSTQLQALQNDVNLLKSVDNSVKQDIATIEGDIAVIKANEDKVYAGVLTAGSTSVVIGASALTDNSFISVFTDIYGVNPSSVVGNADDKTITLQFESQSVDVNIRVRVGV